MNAPESPLDRIEVPAIELPCRIGVAPGESDRSQALRLGLRLHLSLREAANSGRLDDTVDYADLVDRIEVLIQGQVWTLLEGLAGRVAELALTCKGVRRVEVRVEKVAPPWSARRGPVAVVVDRGWEDRG